MTDESKWFKGVIRYGDIWCLIEIRAKSVEDLRLKLRQLIRPSVKIANIEELD